VTVQWCTLEESDIQGHTKGGFHNFGLISAYPNSGNITIHHNLFAHHFRRSPSLTPYVVGKPGDFRNNVVYNSPEGLTHDGHVAVEAINLIGNYYKRGPDSDKIVPFAFHRKGKYYLEDNHLHGAGIIDSGGRLQAGLLAWRRLFKQGTRIGTPVVAAPVTIHAAQAAYPVVLSQAGCFPRDRVTRRTIQEVRSGGGRRGRNGPTEPDDDWFLKGLETADG
jgi:pectate lyase